MNLERHTPVMLHVCIMYDLHTHILIQCIICIYVKYIYFFNFFLKICQIYCHIYIYIYDNVCIFYIHIYIHI